MRRIEEFCPVKNIYVLNKAFKMEASGHLSGHFSSKYFVVLSVSSDLWTLPLTFLPLSYLFSYKQIQDAHL